MNQVVTTERRLRENRYKYEWKSRHREQNAIIEAVRLQKYKWIAINVFSLGTMSCQCCGEDNIYFLSIEHLQGGGLKERKGHAPTTYYRRIVETPDFTRYSVLCFNCNCAKGFFGACPHKEVV